MRDIPTSLAAALDGGVTTHCRCWRLTRKDGVQLGFTDHDRDLVIGGFTFEAASGLDASAMEAESGFASSGGDVSGALTSARILPEDIEAGRYDGAELRSWLVDWSAPALDFEIEVATLGEIRRADGKFIAETRNALHALDAERGRLYGAGCSAELGDTRCAVNMNGPAFRCVTTIATSDGTHRLSAPALANFTTGLFTRGLLRFTSGAKTGLVVAIKEHRDNGELVLWQKLALPMAVGDEIAVTAGCDKRFSTCRDVFANALNFRGFPYIPSPDFVISYAQPGEGTHQGRPLVR